MWNSNGCFNYRLTSDPGLKIEENDLGAAEDTSKHKKKTRKNVYPITYVSSKQNLENQCTQQWMFLSLLWVLSNVSEVACPQPARFQMYGLWLSSFLVSITSSCIDWAW